MKLMSYIVLSRVHNVNVLLVLRTKALICPWNYMVDLIIGVIEIL